MYSLIGYVDCICCEITDKISASLLHKLKVILFPVLLILPSADNNPRI